MNAVAEVRGGVVETEGERDWLGLLPAVAVIVYPFLLDAFHAVAGPVGTRMSGVAIAASTIVLAAAFAVPLIGLLAANRATRVKPSMRRLAYLSVAAPTLYVFLGVVNYMAKSAYPDEVIWTVAWAAIAGWAWYARSSPDNNSPRVARGRVAHGLVAAVIATYVLFHLFNHLFMLAGAGPDMQVMHLGEHVYRAHAVEILLVLAMLFMCASGSYLAWHWSASDARHDFFRTFQIASGVFLMMYIVGHLDSVLIYARLFLGTPTDWKFATGAPAGMIHDAWNIRLLPHYALGAFFVLAHLATGARGIALAHGLRRGIANRLWLGAVMLSAGIAAAIIIGMVTVVPAQGAQASAPHPSLDSTYSRVIAQTRATRSAPETANRA